MGPNRSSWVLPTYKPDNLWFFVGSDPSAHMTGWGWRKSSASALTTQGYWYYDAIAKKIILVWPEAESAPRNTETGVNRRIFDFRGQNFLVMQELDLRYGGN